VLVSGGEDLGSSDSTSDEDEDNTKTVLAARETKQEIRVTEDNDADGDGWRYMQGNHLPRLNHPPRALSVSLIRSEELLRPLARLLAPTSSIR
jgi:hypothetical protein